MAKVPGLSRRRGSRQFRLRVPHRLRETIGKGEIVKSLGAMSHAGAARLAVMERAEAAKSFADAERFLRTEAPSRHEGREERSFLVAHRVSNRRRFPPRATLNPS